RIGRGAGFYHALRLERLLVVALGLGMVTAEARAADGAEMALRGGLPFRDPAQRFQPQRDEMRAAGSRARAKQRLRQPAIVIGQHPLEPGPARPRLVRGGTAK